MSNKKFNALIGVAASVLAGFALFAALAFFLSYNYPLNEFFGFIVLVMTITLVVCGYIMLAAECEAENELDELAEDIDDGQCDEIQDTYDV